MLCFGIGPCPFNVLKGKRRGEPSLEFKFEILSISSPENEVALNIQSLVT